MPKLNENLDTMTPHEVLASERGLVLKPEP